MIEKIKQLHDSNFYGVVVEAGCGVPLANLLFNVEGASKTIYSTFSPYSKDAQIKLFGDIKNRAVSLNNVENVLCSLVKQHPDINFVYYSSFQLTSATEDNKTTHGWIGVAKKVNGKWITCIVHLSYHLHGKTRKDIISLIGDESFLFLYNFLFDNSLTTDVSNIDNVYKGFISSDTVVRLKRLDTDTKELLQYISMNTYVCITPDDIVRVENIFRTKEEISLYKGSFRPITNAHIELVSDFNIIKDSEVFFMISIDTFDKGSQEMESIIWRVKLINKLGYTVIITRNGYFADNADFFRRKFNKPINFLLGSDTMNRIVQYSIHRKFPVPGSKHSQTEEWNLDTDIHFTNCNFWVLIRPHNDLHNKVIDSKRVTIIGIEKNDISATQIRDMRRIGNIEGIRAIMPEVILDDYLKTREE